MIEADFAESKKFSGSVEKKNHLSNEHLSSIILIFVLSEELIYARLVVFSVVGARAIALSPFVFILDVMVGVDAAEELEFLFFNVDLFGFCRLAISSKSARISFSNAVAQGSSRQ